MQETILEYYTSEVNCEYIFLTPPYLLSVIKRIEVFNFFFPPLTRLSRKKKKISIQICIQFVNNSTFKIIPIFYFILNFREAKGTRLRIFN